MEKEFRWLTESEWEQYFKEINAIKVYPMTTIIYNRVSTTEQNPENQLKDCQNLNQWGEAKIIEDRQSAWKDHKERPGFKELQNLISKKDVQHLIVWDLDRIYRNRKKLIEFFGYCTALNCQVHSYRQQWLEQVNTIPTPWNDIVHSLLLQVMGWMAEDESNRKSMRVKAAVRRSPGSKTLSYKGHLWGRKALSSNVVQEVLKLREKGHSLRQISQQVTYRDKNNNRKPLSKSAVHKILAQKS